MFFDKLECIQKSMTRSRKQLRELGMFRRQYLFHLFNMCCLLSTHYVLSSDIGGQAVVKRQIRSSTLKELYFSEGR